MCSLLSRSLFSNRAVPCSPCLRVCVVPFNSSNREPALHAVESDGHKRNMLLNAIGVRSLALVLLWAAAATTTLFCLFCRCWSIVLFCAVVDTHLRSFSTSPPIPTFLHSYIPALSVDTHPSRLCCLYVSYVSYIKEKTKFACYTIRVSPRRAFVERRWLSWLGVSDPQQK